MIGGKRPLVSEIWDQSDRVGAKSPIFDLYSLVAPLPHRSRIRYLSKKKSRILTNFRKLKKIVKIRKKIVKCPSGRGLPTTTKEFDAFHGFMLIKI